LAKAAFLTILLAGPYLWPQAPMIEAQAPIVRSKTRMVVVSVVATDKSGPATNLSLQDFSLLEDGKPQRIVSFAREGSHPGVERKRDSIPPNVFTNRPEFVREQGPVVILLLDLLNTPVADQSYAAQGLLRYLRKQTQPNANLAIFVLGSRLQLLQGFSTDSSVLRKAAEGITVEPSLELSREVLSRDLPLPPRDPHSLAGYLEALSALRGVMAERAQVAVDDRVETTLSAFREIARGVSGFAGRKNLVWISGSFPLTFQPERGSSFRESRRVYYRSYEEEVRQTDAQLGDAQVAVYPVDARGLVGARIEDAAQSLTSESGSAYSGGDLVEALNRNAADQLDIQATMEQVADETGGRALLNLNEVDRSIALSAADGASCYTLAYYPQNKDWQGKFRRIEVKVARGGIHLRYRKGYFAVDASQEVKYRDAELMEALRNDAIPATRVVFDVSVTPVRAPSSTPSFTSSYRIDFLVDSSTLSYEGLWDGGRHFTVEYHAAVLAADGAIVEHTDTRVNTWANIANYNLIRLQGLPFDTTLQVPSGANRLHLVVRDTHTGLLGSLELPLPTPPVAP
jgi:VWFA-related protein